MMVEDLSYVTPSLPQNLLLIWQWLWSTRAFSQVPMPHLPRPLYSQVIETESLHQWLCHSLQEGGDGFTIVFQNTSKSTEILLLAWSQASRPCERRCSPFIASSPPVTRWVFQLYPHISQFQYIIWMTVSMLLLVGFSFHSCHHFYWAFLLSIHPFLNIMLI